MMHGLSRNTSVRLVDKLLVCATLHSDVTVATTGAYAGTKIPRLFEAVRERGWSRQHILFGLEG
jgi:hypothetical protein